MKGFLKFSALAVAAAFALGSCTKEETRPSTSENSLHFIINTAENVQLRSFVENNLNGTYTPKWTYGDELAIFIGTISDKTSSPTATLSNTAKTGTTAKFDGTVTTDVTEGSFLSFSPAGAFEKGYTDGTVGINLSEIQKPSSLTIDEACDVLVAKPCDFIAQEGKVAIDDLFFKRIFSVVKVNLKGVEALNGEKVTSFTFSAPNSTLTGRAAVDLSTASISKWTSSNESIVAKYTTDNPAFGGTDGLENTVWFVVNPTTVASGSTVTFSGETENYTFSKEVTLTKDLTFPQSQMAVINLTIGEGNYTAKTAETRIFVEGFDNVSENKSTPQPSVSGAVGTGVTDNLEYVYTSADVRTSGNGHSSSDYYLWNGTASAVFTINNIAISDKTALLFSCQGRTSQSNTNVTISYKESSASDWINAGSFTATTSSFDTVQKFVLSVNSSATSLDIQITNDAGNLLLDDFVLESFVDNRTTLSAPANVSASVDTEIPNKVNVSWGAVENASGYEVVLSSEGKEDIVNTTSTSSLAVAGLEYSTSYSVKVKATTTDVEKYIESEYSASVSVITGDKPAEAAEWVSKPFASLKTGDKVVIVRTSDANYAMTNDQGTSAAPKAQAVTVVNDKLDKTPESNIVWYVGVDGSNKIFYTSSDKTSWLYCTSTNNGVRVGTNTNKTFTYSSDYLQHVKTSRYLGVYNNADWRCYTSNTGNIGDQTFGFFVEQTGSSEGGSDPVKLAAPVVSCTAKTETSLTFTWGEVANASGYQVSTDGGSTYGDTQTETSYTWEGLTAGTTNTLYVKAIGDGNNYADSEASAAKGTTTAGSGSYSIVFKTATSDGNKEISKTTESSTVVSDGIDYIASFTSNCSKAYYEGVNGVKLGSSKSAGTLEFNLADVVKNNVVSIKVETAKYGSDTGTITMYNGSTVLKSGINPANGYTHKFASPTTVESLKFVTSKRAYISKITITIGK